VTKPKPVKNGNIKPGKIRIEKPRKPRNDGANQFSRLKNTYIIESIINNNFRKDCPRVNVIRIKNTIFSFSYNDVKNKL